MPKRVLWCVKYLARRSGQRRPLALEQPPQRRSVKQDLGRGWREPIARFYLDASLAFSAATGVSGGALDAGA